MKYYKCPSNNVYAYESDEQMRQFAKVELTPIAEGEKAALLAPTEAELVDAVTRQRKEQEAIGVTINGIRYSGEASNRRDIAEAIDYINATGATTFASWKDSDENYHTDHAAQDVIDAYMAIGVKRSALIAKEAQFVADIKAGTLTDVSVLDWTV